VLQAGSEIEYLRTHADTGVKLTGNEFGNIVVGGAGADTLICGSGTNTLYGKNGDDIFRFDTPTGFSKIGDFQSGEDVLQISASGFGHGLISGTHPVVVNAASAMAASHGGSDGYFIFDNAGAGLGTLYWDATGDNGADATVIARLTNASSLSPSAFDIACSRYRLLTKRADTC
jgi:Ca2+-binding RTX toxin-like protein